MGSTQRQSGMWWQHAAHPCHTCTLPELHMRTMGHQHQRKDSPTSYLQRDDVAIDAQAAQLALFAVHAAAGSFAELLNRLQEMELAQEEASSQPLEHQPANGCHLCLAAVDHDPTKRKIGADSLYRGGQGRGQYVRGKKGAALK